MSHDLDDINTSELVEMARKVGHGNAARDREALYDALEYDDPPPTDALEDCRQVMEDHITRNYRKLRTQLPGCNGKCVSFGCPDLVVQRCWMGIKKFIL